MNLDDLAPPKPYAVTERLADVKPEPVTWLWSDRLPAGKLVMLDGDPSLGKSTLALTFAAHVSTGRDWPDGRPCPQGDVVIMSAEDGLADTIRPRLDAAEGDPDRVHALTEVSYVDDGGEARRRPPTLADTDVIADTVRDVGARLLIVDVLMAYLPGKVDSHRDQDVRVILSRLAKIGEETGCTVLLLRHLNKTSGGNAVYRGGGSIGIIGAARAGYVVALDPSDDTESTRVLACTKNNLAPTPPSLTYRLESTPDSHVARVVWGGESTHRAGELLNLTTEEAVERNDALDFLDKYLLDNGGTAKASDVQKEASKAGFSKTTLHRAARKLGVQKQKDSMGGPWWWRHPIDQPPEGSEESTP
ncbi:AAA family ATPase [Amycolatopsis sp. cmx-11-32]|uniref:AAA family ATPase n=1 Tax=Amycolatopsis sp. cmx-11-32 TaxID=2785796 RepID=UPI0039E4EC0A